MQMPLLAEVEQMKLPELVDRLHFLEARRTPVGWSVKDANERSQVETRIMALVGGTFEGGVERRSDLRMPCTFTVCLRSQSQAAKGVVRDVGSGGVFVETEAKFREGEQVEIEVRHYGADEHGLRLLGNVAWRRATEESAGVGLCFANQPSAIHERRLRRFVLELLRYCTEDVDETKEEW